MKSFFKELFAYSHRFNHQLIGIFGENKTRVSERSLKLLNHILNAQQIWNNRIEKEREPFGVWQIHSLSVLDKIDEDNFQRSLKLIDISDFDRKVAYTNSKGIDYVNTVQDILFHVINHSTYHRAQIASDLRAYGIEPPVTDYIFYKR